MLYLQYLPTLPYAKDTLLLMAGIPRTDAYPITYYHELFYFSQPHPRMDNNVERIIL